MITIFAIILAFLASAIYILILFKQIKNATRKNLSLVALFLGLSHAGLMIYTKNLSLFELSTYQKCLPITTTFLVLSLISYFYSQFGTPSFKIIKKLAKN